MRESRSKGPFATGTVVTAFLTLALVAVSASWANAEVDDPVLDALAAMRSADSKNEAAEEVAPESVDAEAQEPAAADGGGLGKLQVHGFLTQAYAEADFTKGGFRNPTNDEVVLGIPEDGTTDYRNMAIQFRYEIGPRDIAVIQLSHRRLGTSPVRQIENEVDVDWAFYERRIGDASYVKIGRIQIPFGIFNEVRDVGTVLPFFRPPFQFYREGSLTTETVDGALFGHTFWSEKSTNLDFDLYYGGWSFPEFLPPGTGDRPGFGQGDVVLARAEDGLGVQLWLNTPAPGLRFGGLFQRSNIQGGILELPGTKITQWFWGLSIDAVFSRFVARAEFHQRKLDINSPAFINVQPDTYYVQLGYHLTDKLRFYVQYEDSVVESESQAFAAPLNNDTWQDTAVAINYAFTPNLVLKLETHEFDVEQSAIGGFLPPPGPMLPPRIVFLQDTARDGRHTILSVSASF